MRESLTFRVKGYRFDALRMSLSMRGGFIGRSFITLLMQYMGADEIRSLEDVSTPGDMLFQFTWNNGIPANIRERIMAMQVEIEAPIGHALPMAIKALDARAKETP